MPLISRLLTLTLAALMAIYMLVLLGGVFAAFKTSQKDEEGPYLALEELDEKESVALGVLEEAEEELHCRVCGGPVEQRGIQ